jgi:membrane associated rhomboid family serine protease
VLLVLGVLPGAAERLEYDAARIEVQPWTLVTSQLVHWSRSMLFGDALLVGIAGSIVERRSRRLAGAAIVLGGGAAALAIAWSGLTRYRGSSGIGTALLVAGGLDLAIRGTTRSTRIAGAAALGVGLAKLALDASGLTASILPDGIVTAAGVHAAAAGGGLVAWLATASAPSRRTPP